MPELNSIIPIVLIDGKTIEIEGWMFVLAFALRGIEWAVKQALDPEFKLREKAIAYFKDREISYIEDQIAILNKKLEELREL